MILFLIFFFNFFVYSTATCPVGSVPFFNDKSHCIYFKSNKTSFLDAEEVCMDLGGHLVSVHDPLKNMFLSQQAMIKFTESTDGDFWTGANDISAPPKWVWMDDTAFDYENWDNQQPQNVSGANCGVTLIHGGKWKADDCCKAKPFVCMTKASDVPIVPTAPSKSCLDDWTFYDRTGYCYKVFGSSNWLDAEDRCKIDGAHLVSIHSADEDRFVADFANYAGANVCDSHKQIWIGLFTEDVAVVKWKWTDGTPYDYKNWFPGYPKPGLCNCAYMHIAPICNYKAGLIANNIQSCKEIIARYVCKMMPT